MSNNTITLSDAEYDFLINEAREAGRREGLLGIAGGLAMIKHAALQGDADSIVKAMIASVDRALIDSPKAEGEKPPKMLYVAFDCLGNPYAVSTRPEHIACDPARIKPYVPVEAARRGDEMSVNEFFAYLYGPQGQHDLLERVKEMGREEAAELESVAEAEGEETNGK